jgi:hypothetical protein
MTEHASRTLCVVGEAAHLCDVCVLFRVLQLVSRVLL